MHYINIEKVCKTFTTSKNSFTALTDVNLSVGESEFVCILGPSGCGKSTLLRIVAGLEQATSGKVSYNGKEINQPDKKIGMVFQNYSLMPWLTVRENISLGLRFDGKSKQEQQNQAERYLEMINMKEFGNAYPYELSGGMQQRVAIARALANEPDVLLMDEPFGALDAYTRIVLQKELLSIWQKHKKTILFVTHSVDEAIYLADRIIFMPGKVGGKIQEIQVDMPRIRERKDPRYGELTDQLLMMFDAVEQ